MRLGKDSTLAARIVTTAGILMGMALIGHAQQAQGGERKFLVFLANSPKSYPDSNGAPVDGLPPRSLIDDEYFDKLNPDIGSFAEYWEEISYRDVTITGLTTEWISLPWPVRPPADVDGNPNSPENYYDLNNTGQYEYGWGEEFNNSLTQVVIDLDGNPDDSNNGPFSVGLGSFDVTRSCDAGGPCWPVWRPGERFVDVDNDNKWDGLDEATNTMDHTGPDDRPDGQPDLQGPWIDLNGDGNPENADNDCTYLDDSDNDGNPDCCPNGPFGGPCECGPTTWAQSGGQSTIVDCNGNLVPDECDILTNANGDPCFGAADCVISQDCRDTGWLDEDPNCRQCGRSLDALPFKENTNGECAADPDQIPDECQFLNAEIDPQDTRFPDCQEQQDNPENACSGREECTIRDSAIEPIERCEYADSNGDNSLDIVEPFENFLRRWDSCMTDPDVHPTNLFTNATHWVKVYDPHSQAGDVTCFDPFTSINYAASTANQPVGSPLHRASYIENNYPGDWRAVEAMAHSRVIWGSHDPHDLLGAGECHCPISCATDDDCPGGPNAVCDTGVGLCACVDDPEIYDTLGRIINTRATLSKACPAGSHADYDPPDRWTNAIDDQNPSGITRYTTKMRARPGPLGQAGYLVQRTPEPGGLTDETEWFEQSWKDRYPGGPGHPASAVLGYQGCDDPNSEFGFIDCEKPPWPESSPVGGPNVLEIVPFDDVDPDVYTNNVFYHRRFFSANWGGLNGDGTGWTREGCSDLGPSILFETGVLSDDEISFVQGCDAPILPEEVNGAGSEAEFYDGWVEHDDLPSSKYHKAGDQRLGEITSPFSYTQEYTPPWGADNDPQPVQVAMIWGEDLGDHNPDSPRVLDAIIAAAGPYATNIHGNGGRDAGNLLTMELLTWRTEPPFNNGTAWAQYHGFHPYAGPFGANLGFRDYNLDGLIDQGEVRPAGSENYIADSIDGTGNNGTNSIYPFNRRRLLEDCVEVVDRSIDFDDFVDADAMNAATGCGSHPFSADLFSRLAPYPAEYQRVSRPSIAPAGIASGIVLMPTLPGDDGGGGLFPVAPRFYPIHNDDGLTDPPSTAPLLPAVGTPQLSWNLFFHDLVKIMDDGTAGPATVGFETSYAAREYLHSWEGFPDLFDYDVLSPDGSGATINCPVGGWDIMANGGLVHPTPPLKERPCSKWIDPVDLTTVLTPGVPTVLTLPPAEIVRDDAYYFLENEANPGERIYLWSAGSGFDVPGSPGRGGFAGQGVMIMHAELSDDPDVRPHQDSPPFQFRIIQADGLRELEDGYTQGLDNSCAAITDDGDPWPGSSDKRLFDCDTNPPSRWNQGNRCTGLTVSGFELDDFGGATVTVTWRPTSIPLLEFVDPPGGVSVADIYSIKFLANDVYGGTTIELYYTTDENSLVLDAQHHIGTLNKIIRGRIEMNAAWDISDMDDGRYFLFAKLVPGSGADGDEQFRTNPRPGRNNAGTGVLVVPNDNSGVKILGNKARLETWTLRLVDVAPDGVQDWIVNSTLSQLASEDPNDDPYPHLTVDAGGVGEYDVDQVHFWLYNKSCSDGGEPCSPDAPCSPGATCDRGPAFEIGDTWSFKTTGITDVSRPLIIDDGEIDEAPKAVIFAAPVSGDPPLDVELDGLSSTEPNGASLTYAWDFGDGTQASGARQDHVFTDAKTYTVVLTVTSSLPPNLFDQTTVDIEVTNNAPTAIMTASPLSGTPGPQGLLVSFNGSGSHDTETASDALIYQWDFGDGLFANDEGIPGILVSTARRYTSDALYPCDPPFPEVSCYTAKLTITDEGGKQDVATVEITVGNTRPDVDISHSGASGTAPWTVVFNASDSSDPDGDELRVDWFWGDGSSDLDVPLTGLGGATDGSVPHTFNTAGQYSVTASVNDGRGGVSEWSGVTVTVSDAAAGSSDPQAIFTVDPENPEVDEEVTFDASLSFDRPAGSPSASIASYTWDWGDGSGSGSGKIAKHTYTAEDTYTIKLTVVDGEGNQNGTSKTIIVAGVGESVDDEEENERPVAAFTVDPAAGLAGITEFSFDAGASVDPDGDTLSYSWNFRDGSRTETGQTTTHVFIRTGTFNVILTVRDPSNAVATSTIEITITTDVLNAAPFAIIAAGPRAGSAPFAVQLDGSLSYDPDGDRLTYAWSQNGIVQSDKTESKATFVFDSAGDYEIVLTVNDGKVDGETSSDPVDIHVNGRGGGDSGAGQTVPDDGDPDATTGGATGSPFSFCGLGMLTSLFGSLLGLSAMRLTRRRRL